MKTVGALNSSARSTERAEVVRLASREFAEFRAGMAARQIAAAQGLSLAENARAFALIMMGINDSLIASFYNKYHYVYWRPETAIPAGAVDGNDKTDLDATYAPFISTPCFPSYPSNHASGTNGGLEVMRRLFGAAGHDITFTNTVPPSDPCRLRSSRGITRSSNRLLTMSTTHAYIGGIITASTRRAGDVLGRAIATEIYKNNLRPVHGRP